MTVKALLWSTTDTTKAAAPTMTATTSTTWNVRCPVQRGGIGFTDATVVLGTAVRQWEPALVDRMRNAWREDRLQFVLVFAYLVLGLVSPVRHPDAWNLAYGVVLVGCAVAQAYAVLVQRPRRLERTGQRGKPRWGSR